jgi:O-antigen/teichoic acid export membrane protein
VSENPVGAEVRGLSTLGRNALYYSLPPVVGRAVAIFLTPVFSRILTRADYGTIAIAMTTGQIFVLITSLGQGGTIERFYFDYRKGSFKSVYTTLVLFPLLFTALSLALVWLLWDSTLGTIIRGVPFFPLILVAMVGLTFTHVGLGYLRLLKLRGHARRFAALQISQNLLVSAFSFFLIVVMRWGAAGNIFGMLAGASVMLAVIMYLQRSEFVPRLDPGVIKPALVFGIPLVFHGLSVWISQFADRYFLEYYWNLDELGLYSVAYTFVNVFLMFIMALNQTNTPFIYSNLSENTEEARRRVARGGTYMVAFVLLIGAALAGLAREILFLLTGPRFHEAYDVVPPLAAAYVCYAVYYLTVDRILFVKRSYLLPVLTIGTAGINLALNFLLIPGHGRMGAATATLISYAAIGTATYLISQRCYRIRFEYSRLARLVLSAAGAACAAYFLPVRWFLDGASEPKGSHYPVVLVIFVVKGALVVGLMVGLNLAMRTFSKDEIRRGLQLVSGKLRRILRRS